MHVEESSCRENGFLVVPNTADSVFINEGTHGMNTIPDACEREQIHPTKA